MLFAKLLMMCGGFETDAADSSSLLIEKLGSWSDFAYTSP